MDPFSREIIRLKQLLINKNIPDYNVDKFVRNFMNKKQISPSSTTSSLHVPSSISNPTSSSNLSSISDPSSSVTSSLESSPLLTVTSSVSAPLTTTPFVTTSDFVSTPLVTGISTPAASSSTEISPTDNASSIDPVKMYFQSQMTSNYQQYEKNLRNIIFSNVKPAPDRKLLLQIFYKSRKLKNLFVKNNVNKPEHESSLIYKYTCKKMPCTEADAFYIGLTTVTLKERFKQHRSVKKHFHAIHKEDITCSEMLRDVSVIAKCPNKQDLPILEALFIKELNPIINRQTDDFVRTLKIF